MTAATAPTVHPWHRQAPRLGTSEEFAALRRLLEETGYSYEGMCRRLGVDDLDNYTPPAAEELMARPMEDGLDALMRLFYHSVYADEAALERALPARTLGILHSLGLLARDPARPGMVFAASAILAAAGLLTVCDRGNHAPDGSRCELPSDVVYPAIFDTTKKFLEGLPDGPCEAMLDLGTGTGIAAMLGARWARHVWATDITERSALFAEFNRRLYGLENMTVAAGDLFAPVAGLTFDRIVIHPPYVPAKQSKLVFRDAGQDGEQIIRRTIEELPQYLRPGGRFYSLQIATDREGEAFEDRIRKWLGPGQADFDVVIGARSMQTPREFLAQLITAGRVNMGELPNLVELWNETKTVIVVYAAVLIERHSSERAAVTKRLLTGPGYSGRHLMQLLEWEKASGSPEFAEALLRSRPVVAPDCELHVVSRMHDGRLAADEFTFESRGAFRSRCRCDAGLAQVLMGCDGSKTLRQLYEEAKAAGMIPAEADAIEFAGVVGGFIGDGILRLE